MKSPRYVIFLSESAPGLNKGEEAILRGLLRTLTNHLGEFRFILFSDNIEADRRIYGKSVEIIGRSDSRSLIIRKLLVPFWLIAYMMFGRGILKWVKNKTLRSFLESDLILFGHDAILASNTISLAFILKVIIMRIIGKPSAICAGSFGPFKNRIVEVWARILLRYTNLILIRDRLSYEYCLKLYNKAEKIHLVPDLAFLLQPASYHEARAIYDTYNIPCDRPIIGLTVATNSSVVLNASSAIEKSVEKRKEIHIEIMAQVVSYLQNKYNVSIIFLPHCIEINKNNDDRVTANKIYNLLPNKSNVWLIEDEYSAAQLKAMIGVIDLLIAERTHSMIGAASMGVPFVSLSFKDDFRTFGIVSKMLGQEKCFYDICNLSKESLCDLIDNCWDMREKIKKVLKNQVPQILTDADKTGRLLFTLLRQHYEC